MCRPLFRSNLKATAFGKCLLLFKVIAIGLAPVATTIRHSVAETQPELTRNDID